MNSRQTKDERLECHAGRSRRWRWLGVAAALGLLATAVPPAAADLDLQMTRFFEADDVGAMVMDDDRFGDVAVVGDFNADGHADLVVSYRGQGFLAGGAAAGIVRVVPGSLDGPMLGEAIGIDQDALVGAGTGRGGDSFGDALGVGDFNADGFDDLAVGARAARVGEINDAGVVYVVYGSPSGLDTSLVTVVSQAGEVPGAPEQGDGFGAELAAGDFDADGFDDLAIGVPNESLKGNTLRRAGLVVVVRGSTAGITTTGAQKFAERGPIAGRALANDRFGSVLAAGDFDGDGDDDLAVGSPDNFGESGAVNIILGSPGVGLSFEGNFAITQKGPIPGKREFGDQFGAALAVGDLDGDGYDDLVVGAPGEFSGPATSSSTMTPSKSWTKEQSQPYTAAPPA